ncbi:MAG: hypothetical protein LUE09_11045 [Synergistaceae bacterium]|nr:hypothetical protein [Synergistaceae bacterium]
MAENRTFRNPTLAEAVIVVLALFLPITIGNIIFGYNIILMLLVAGSLGLPGLFYGHAHWLAMERN